MKKNKLLEKQIKHLAKLAGLSLTSQELNELPNQLSEIIDYFEILKELDTKGIESTSQVTGLENIFDNDKPIDSLSVESALKNTESKHDNFFKVKAVLKR